MCNTPGLRSLLDHKSSNVYHVTKMPRLYELSAEPVVHAAMQGVLDVSKAQPLPAGTWMGQRSASAVLAVSTH